MIERRSLLVLLAALSGCAGRGGAVPRAQAFLAAYQRSSFVMLDGQRHENIPEYAELRGLVAQQLTARGFVQEATANSARLAVLVNYRNIAATGGAGFAPAGEAPTGARGASPYSLNGNMAMGFGTGSGGTSPSMGSGFGSNTMPVSGDQSFSTQTGTAAFPAAGTGGPPPGGAGEHPGAQVALVVRIFDLHRPGAENEEVFHTAFNSTHFLTPAELVAAAFRDFPRPEGLPTGAPAVR